jgi:hypothetical protein
MTKRRSQPDPVAIDGRSPDVVLEYSGGRTPRFVPARDLSGGDLARIAYRRAALAERASRSTKIRPGELPPVPRRPGPATTDELEQLAAALEASGAFARVAPPASVTPEPDQGPQPGPATPGDPIDEPPAEPVDQEA